jgi:hypothetical protein
MKKILLLLLLFLITTSVSGQYWKEYSFVTGVYTNITYPALPPGPSSDATMGNYGVLPYSMSLDTLRNSYPLDFVNDASSVPWRMTVMWENGCSAVLIDPYHILFPGHLLPQGWQGYRTRKVYPACDQGNFPYDYAQLEASYMASNWAQCTGTDYEIVKLDRPIGALIGWYGFGYNEDNFFVNNKFWSLTYPMASPYPGNVMYSSKHKMDYALTDFLYSFRSAINGMSGGNLFNFISNGTPVTYGILACSGIKYIRITLAKYYYIKQILDYNTPSSFDLIPLYTNIYPNYIQSGYDADSLTFYIHNYSSQNYTSGVASANIYISTDSIITGSDKLIQTINLTDNILAKTTSKIKVSEFITYDLTPGTYWVGAILSGDSYPSNDTMKYLDAKQFTVGASQYVKILGKITSTQTSNGISGVTLGGFSSTVKTDYNGDYTTYVPVGSSYTITPSKQYYSFNPASFSVSNIQRDTVINLSIARNTFLYKMYFKTPISRSPAYVQAPGLIGEPFSDANGLIQTTLYSGYCTSINFNKSGWYIDPSSISIPVTTENRTDTVFAGFLVRGALYTNLGAPARYLNMNGFPITVLSDINGIYQAFLDSGWSGTVTLSGGESNPPYRVYSNLSASYYYHNYTVTILPYITLKVFLSGAYEKGKDTMSTKLNQLSLFPNTPPDTFSNLEIPFILINPSQYIINTSKSLLVDWILIECLNATNLNSVDTIVGLLQKNGKVVGLSGDTCLYLSSSVVQNGYYHFIIRHRNHIAIITADSISILYGSPNVIDLSADSSKVQGKNVKLLKIGLYGMYGGDANFDGIVNNADYSLYILGSKRWKKKYSTEDFNLDGYTTPLDSKIFSLSKSLRISAILNF